MKCIKSGKKDKLIPSTCLIEISDVSHVGKKVKSFLTKGRLLFRELFVSAEKKRRTWVKRKSNAHVT